MIEEKIKGGKRNNSGRKPSDDKKKPVVLYIRQSKIKLNGGEEKLKIKIYDLIDYDFVSNPVIQKISKVFDAERVKIDHSDEPRQFETSEIDDNLITNLINKIKAEKIPAERNTPSGKKVWAIDQQKKIFELESKLK